MSSSLSNPSTTAPSIFSFTASHPSEANFSLYDTSIFETSSLGKHGKDFRLPRKRRKINGRPKNCWTSTRLRKLTRLYLMTDLDVVDIIKTLETENFTPCHRDVQKQLRTLLQPRPDKIRLKGPFTRRRLQQLRECKKSRKSRHLSKPHCQTSDIPQFSSNSDEDVNEPNWEELPSAGDDSAQGSTWLDHAMPRASANVDSCGFISTKLSNIQEDAARISRAGSSSFRGKDNYQMHCRPPESEVTSQPVQDVVEMIEQLSNSKFDLNLPEFGIASVPSKFSCPSQPSFPTGVERDALFAKGVIGNCKMRLNAAGFLPSDREDANPKTENHHSKSAGRPIAKVNCGFLREELESGFVPSMERSSHPVARVHSEYRHTENEARSISSIGGSSCRSNTLDFRSLRRRLPPKYSRSFLDDVMSVLQHLTVSGSSAFSSIRAEKRLSKASTSSQSHKIDPELSPTFLIADLISPCTPPSTNFLRGASPGYCWEQIMPKAVRRCNGMPHPETRGGPPSGPGLSVAIRTTVLSSLVNNINRAEDLSERDQFGNSILHIAGSLSNVSEIESLINLGADVNSLNHAGQTFLHLAAESHRAEYKGIGTLLRIAREHGFDFRQLDHLGQSVIHLLTRPWMPPHILDMVIATLYDLGIDPTSSRDYLGWTVVEQLNYFSSRDLEYDPVRETAILGLTCEKEGHITDQIRLNKRMEKMESAKYDDLCSHNFKSPTSIETLADLEQYTYHAELLKTIIRATSLPWFEDSRGRNGLHCLAEVSLTLSGHFPSSQGQSLADNRPPRGRNLVDLLTAGVDPNNYDKKGNTPLMAFITHTRLDEDGALTTRILQKLVNAGANVHWRNRQGETALHIAIKLGRRAATEFLLQKKANVHARTGNGKGVLALGQDFSWKARDDVAVYAQIELCMSLAIDRGAIAAPTVFQEWKCS